MNGAADLGGMMGFGPLQLEENAPNFHAKWEERVMAMTVAMGAGGKWNIDASRSARETLPPGEYLTSSYYRIWYRGLTRLMLAQGMVDEGELLSGTMNIPPVPVKNVLTADNVASTLAKGGPVDRPASGTPAFQIGDRVATRNINPDTHTRLPRYARGKTGTIQRINGFHVFPDSNAQFAGENPCWLYCVQFSARELWGDERPENDRVHLDLWEPYLDAAN